MKYSLAALASFALSPLLSGASPIARENRTSPNPDFQRRGDDVVDIASMYHFKDDNWIMHVQKACTDHQRQEIINAIAEAGYLANALRQWNPHAAYQASFDKYMGKGTANDLHNEVRTVLDKQWDIHRHEQAAGVRVYIFCDEKDEQVQKDRCKNGMPAYTFTEDWTAGRRHKVVLCPPFFDDRKTASLGKKLNDARKYPHKQKELQSLVGSRGSLWLHETFHWEETITKPKAVDDFKGKRIYGPNQVADFAAKHGAAECMKIADCWTMTALSNMMMQTFGLREPPASGPSVTLFPRADEVEDDKDDKGKDGKGKDGKGKDGKGKDGKGKNGNGKNESGTKDEGDEVHIARLWVDVTASMATINPNDYAAMPPPTLPTCDDNDEHCNHVSSCGTEWMPLDNWKKDGNLYRGYKDVVEEFCTELDRKPVAAGYRRTYYSQVGLDQGVDPQENPTYGVLEFEVRNKQDEVSHEIRKLDCKRFFMEMTHPNAKGSNCYGDKNHDTKGGTFQLGKDAISYHALAWKGDVSTLQDLGIDVELGKPYTTTEPVIPEGWDSNFDPFEE